MNKKKKIFIIAYGGSHIKLLIPIIRKLELTSNYDILIYGLPGAIPDLIKEKLNYVTYLNFLADVPNEYFKNRTVNEIVELNHNTSFPFSKFESLAYLVCNIIDYSRFHNISFDDAAFEIKKNGRQVFFPTFFFKKILTIIYPDIIVSTISPKSERAALHAGYELGIKTVSLDDLFGNHFKHPPAAEYTFVMSEYVKHLYETNPNNKSIPVITGNPYLQSFYDSYLKDWKNIKGEEYVLFLYQNVFFDLATRQILPIPIDLCITLGNNLIDIFGKKGKKIAIRNHPNLLVQERLNLEGVINLDDIDLNAALSKCSVVIGFDSTVLLQALILNKKIIEIKVNELVSTLDLYQKGLADRISLEDSEFISEANKTEDKDLSYYVKYENSVEIITNQLINLINETHKF